MSTKKKEKKTGLIGTDATVAENRRARFDYEIEEKFEAGIALLGSEVKSLRLGQCSINESHVGPQKGELWIWNLHIPEYQQAGPHLQHPPRRFGVGTAIARAPQLKAVAPPVKIGRHLEKFSVFSFQFSVFSPCLEAGISFSSAAHTLKTEN